MMNRPVLGLLALLLLPVAAQDSEKGLSQERIRKHVEVLASDELEGRLPGYPGAAKGEAYIAKQLEDIGCKPLGETKDGKRTFFQTFSHSPELTTRNVVGWIEGSDPKLKDEAVVLCAHHDHLGKIDQSGDVDRFGRVTDDDEIFNGADDNASGVAVVLEIARVLRGLAKKPRRSVILFFPSAEEMGLLGSKHFVKNPPEEFPIGQQVVMFNLDMVGRNPDKPCLVKGTGTCKAWEPILDRACKATGARLRYASSIGGGSDHLNFAAKRIPAVHFYTGEHADYHRRTDHADRVDYAHATRIGRAVYHAACEFANLSERPEWRGR